MNLISLALTGALSIGTVAIAHAADPKATLTELNARLTKIGAAHVDGKDDVGGKSVPALYFGDRKINNNFDVVDALRKSVQATATVFVKDGDEFVRVSTNALTAEGKRGIGTPLAHNAAYAALGKGDSFCGPVDVLGTAFDACYDAIKDASGKVVGAGYVGFKK